jgi:hypothetical protein
LAPASSCRGDRSPSAEQGGIRGAQGRGELEEQGGRGPSSAKGEQKERGGRRREGALRRAQGLHGGVFEDPRGGAVRR